jgi:hypothetical protein
VLSLLAFTVAAAVTALRLRAGRDLKLVELAQEKSRPELVNRVLERVDIDTSSLTAQQKFQLALEQMRERRRRLSVVLVTVIAIASLFLVGFLTTGLWARGPVSRAGDNGPVVQLGGQEPTRPLPSPTSDKWKGYLGDVMVSFVLAGKVNPWLLSAFVSIVRATGDPKPLDQIRTWVAHAKTVAADELRMTKGQLAFLDIRLDVPLDDLSAEDAFHRLWMTARERDDAPQMAGTRLAMIELLGEERQQQLISDWTR